MKGRCFTSDPQEQCYHIESQVTFTDRADGGERTINVFPHHQFQRVEGFGGSFTEAAGVVYNTMPEAVREELLEDYFSAQGNCYNLARLPIQSCDFSLGNYAYAGSAEDIKYGRLNFARDRQNLIPFIRDALAVNANLVLMASPWSPPAFMKTSANMNGGGQLRLDAYPLWAEMIVQFLLEYRRQGINIHRLSVQNEPVAVKPWESCLYSAEQETDFAVNHLRPLLERHGLGDTELYIWDHDKDGLVDWAERAFANEASRREIDGLAFHWYTGDHFAQIQHLARHYPEKKLLFTEGCVPMEEGAGGQTRHFDTYLHDMIGNFKAGCMGFIDWNLLLDGSGGPNHPGNLCEAPIQFDLDRGQLRRNSSYYGIAHFSRYVRPDARVMLSSSYDATLEEVGFVHPDGERVLVVYNRSGEIRQCRIVDGARETMLTLNAGSVCTLVWPTREETDYETWL
ncbi:glycoside hydrolase family 30 beta sandwich domain-containing protein [uncultured Pluralibacter sp.]|uniref:glycoside hydrolase family 30 protein n=1 Tax=uncultured Pluralibacter sp. TaxID=1490864 RepID=UPI002604A74D|nr:glycoside hydrolase family 30 beta sandwich domain-containing protein [uncultured Pluralibacter sp.]